LRVKDVLVPVFLIVRHGENDMMRQGRLACRLPGVHLNETGRAQANAAAQAILQVRDKAVAQAAEHAAQQAAKQKRKRAAKKPDKPASEQPPADAPAPVWRLYSSPMERAVETAEPIAQALGLELDIRPGLIETNCGDWAGMKVKGLSRRKLWRVIQNNPSQFQFPGGESFIECQQRIVGEIEALRAQHGPMDTIICVSHADPIKLLVAHHLGLALDNFQRLSIGPASITMLHVSESGSRLLALNIPSSFSLAMP
jgi:broad specificity phosphatase PhoE